MGYFKIDSDTVLAIRAARAAGATHTQIAAEFDISRAQSCRISTGKRWPLTPGPRTVATTYDSEAQRFWAKVTPGAEDECWEWEAGDNGIGYGLFYRNGHRMGAHRFSYELANGTIPDGLVVRHKCDNPPCINPAHLEIGTQADNIADAFARGRR